MESSFPGYFYPLHDAKQIFLIVIMARYNGRMVLLDNESSSIETYRVLHIIDSKPTPILHTDEGVVVAFVQPAHVINHRVEIVDGVLTLDFLREVGPHIQRGEWKVNEV